MAAREEPSARGLVIRHPQGVPDGRSAQAEATRSVYALLDVVKHVAQVHPQPGVFIGVLGSFSVVLGIWHL